MKKYPNHFQEQKREPTQNPPMIKANYKAKVIKLWFPKPKLHQIIFKGKTIKA